jgi:MoxR-like ATPase
MPEKLDLGFKRDLFDPVPKGKADPELQLVTVHGGDGPPSYVYNRSIILAVNLARAAGRPLFIAGRPGTGKTTLAANVAFVLGWKYYQRVVTSRTRAKDLQWTFDSLRRLSDAQEQGKTLPPRAAYVQPQEFWWAFSPETARLRGARDEEQPFVTPAEDPVRWTPPEPGTGDASTNAVLLLDEIDKADPDVPNDLLEVLDIESFQVDELDKPRTVSAKRNKVLLMITSNGERELPPAFLRRCVVLHLESPNAEWLVRVANDRFGGRNEALHRQIAKRVMDLREVAEARDLREPSTAEYLDAVAACVRLDITDDEATWKLVENSLLSKRDARDAGEAVGP